MYVKRILGVAVLAGALVMAGCEASNSSDTDVAPVAGDATTTSVQVTTPSQDKVLSLVGGGTIDLTRGPTAKPIAMWFWAPG